MLSFLSKKSKEKIMGKSKGRYVSNKIGGESYKAYIPPSLNDYHIDLEKLYPYLERANKSITELNSINIPNISLFIYMYVRKEALLSSQIEGTQSSFSDLILFESNQKTNISTEDVEEVSNYVKALDFALTSMKDELPLSLRLLRETHRILLSGTRGQEKLPGEFRKSQNWIGGTRPGNAIFVPPPPEYLNNSLDDLEKFLHRNDISILIKAGLAHFGFETIHPFLDGNGRLGRLLINLILCNEGLLNKPILYLSLYLKQNRQSYYNLLQEARATGSIQTWLEFFLEGVDIVSNQAIDTAYKINELFERDLASIESLGRSRFTIQKVFEYLKILPQISTIIAAKELGLTAPTARMALETLCKMGIVEEISGKKRDKIYIYRKYLGILEQGTEPL